MTRPITRFVDVQVTKDTARVSAAGFGIPLVLTNTSIITTAERVKSFTSLASVNTVFDSTTEEGKAADAFFQQDPFLDNQPGELLFGRYVDAVIAAVIECGDSPLATLASWQAITDGEFGIDIDGGTVDVAGLDFSTITSLDDVATVIGTGLGANGDCVFLVNRFIINSGTTGASSTITVLKTVVVPAGTDISGSGFIDGDSAVSPNNPGGSRLSQGQIAETAEGAITAIENANDDWAASSIVKALRDIQVTEDIADAIESRRKMFFAATNDANTLVSGATSDISYLIRDKNYKRSVFIYHDNADLYPDLSWLGQQLPKAVGSTNWAYKILAGIAEGAAVDIPAVDLTQAQIEAALGKNCNIYTSTLGNGFTYFGTSAGGKNVDKEGEFIDIIRNIDFLQARTEEGLLSLLIEKDIINMTNAGIGITENRTINLLQQFGVDQGILVDGTIVVTYPKRSEISQTDRDDRLLPSGTFVGELTGGVNKIILRGIVSI